MMMTVMMVCFKLLSNPILDGKIQKLNKNDDDASPCLPKCSLNFNLIPLPHSNTVLNICIERKTIAHYGVKQAYSHLSPIQKFSTTPNVD